jgi:hypothetical protein
MFALISRVLLGRIPTMVIDLVVMSLMSLSILDLWWPGHRDVKELISDASVLMIGWGVALEERDTVRKLLGARTGLDEELESRIDRASHGIGLLLLLIGLVAEIFAQIAGFRTAILDMRIAREVLLSAGVLCIVLGIGLLAGHVIRLAALKRTSPVDAGQKSRSG